MLSPFVSVQRKDKDKERERERERARERERDSSVSPTCPVVTPNGKLSHFSIVQWRST